MVLEDENVPLVLGGLKDNDLLYNSKRFAFSQCLRMAVSRTRMSSSLNYLNGFMRTLTGELTLPSLSFWF